MKEGMTKEEYIVHLEAENALLKEENNYLKLKLFGRSSEKSLPEKDRKFNEAEESVEKEAKRPPQESKGRQKNLLSAIPRKEIKSALSLEQLHCCGKDGELIKIGEQARERLDIIPAKFIVNRYIEESYKCSCCGKITTTEQPKKIIPKGDVDSGLLTELIINKYDTHIPLYRHEEIFERLGVDIGRNTSARWVIQAAEATRPLMNLMQEDLQKSDYVQCDETPVQVLNETNRSPTSKSYMWVLRNANSDKKMVLFTYEPSRSGATAMNLLDGMTGAIQTDGYTAYNGVSEHATHLACWAHVRRKFDEAIKAMEKEKGKKAKKRKVKTYADIGLQFVNILYRIDRLAKKVSINRQRRMEKVLQKFEQWLKEASEAVPPKTYTGRAINYALGIWGKLYQTAVNEQYLLDNNLCENAIRPFALGRKNWLFAASERGADASAILYSLIQSAKQNDLNPRDYIYAVLEEIPKAKELADFEKLLPYNWKPPS